MEQKVRRLTRSKKNKVIAGVCGGLGDYFNVDPVLFRIAFVALTMAGGSGVLLYIILAIIVPEEGVDDKNLDEKEKIKKQAQSAAEDFKRSAKDFGGMRDLVGYFFIALGLFALLGLIIPHFFNWDIIWAIILVGIGIYLITKNNK